MELVVKTPEEKDPLPMQHRLGKMILGATAGFIATALVEKMYDSFLEFRQNKATVEVQK